MGNRIDYLKKQIADISKTLDMKGFVANHDGNISTRFEDGLLATPSAESKAAIFADMIITLDMSGKKIAGIGSSFSEIKLHLAAYRARDDAVAVIHAHPPFSTAMGLTGSPLKISLPEAIVSIGDTIPIARYAMPGAAENDDIISEALQISDVFMMAGNGVLAIGDDLEQAYLRLELVEHLAKIQHYTRGMGNSFTLPESDREKLLAKRASIGLGPQARLSPLSQNGHIPNDLPTSKAVDNSVAATLAGDELKNLIAQEIKKLFEGK